MVWVLVDYDHDEIVDLLALTAGVHGLQTAFCSLMVWHDPTASLARAFLYMESTVNLVVYVPCLWVIYSDYLYAIPPFAVASFGLYLQLTQPKNFKEFPAVYNQLPDTSPFLDPDAGPPRDRAATVVSNPMTDQ